MRKSAVFTTIFFSLAAIAVASGPIKNQSAKNRKDKTFREPAAIQGMGVTETFKINQAMPRTPTVINPFAVSLRTGRQSKEVLGGVVTLEPNDNTRFLLITSQEVMRKICDRNMAANLYVQFDGLKGKPGITLPCKDALSVVNPSKKELSLAVVLIPRSKVPAQTLLVKPKDRQKLVVPKMYKHQGSQVYVLCKHGPRPNGEVSLGKINDNSIVVHSSNVEKCAGSPVFQNGGVVGIFTGIDPVKKWSVFQMMSGELIASIQEAVRNNPKAEK